jgi:hypothetical protein
MHGSGGLLTEKCRYIFVWHGLLFSSKKMASNNKMPHLYSYIKTTNIQKYVLKLYHRNSLHNFYSGNVNN